MSIDRCVCKDVSFEKLKSFAESRCCGLEQIELEFGCGSGCALCVPYIRLMLKTGQTSFSSDQTLPDDSRLS
jgi:bacterioferritin-associated ferredoxin